MDDFSILLGILMTGSITINIYLVKQISDLCQRISKLEGYIQHKHE
jgi:hypothetical protein